MAQIIFEQTEFKNFEATVSRFPGFSERALSSAIKSEAYRMRNMVQSSNTLGGAKSKPYAELSPHYIPIRQSKKSWGRQWMRNPKRISPGYYRRKTKMEKEVKKAGGHFEQTQEGLRALRRIGNMVRYEYNPDNKTATVGYLDKRVADRMNLHAEGYSVHITSRMRRMLFAAGMPLQKGTSELKVPARPIVEPVFEQEKDRIINNVKLKTLRNIYRYLTGKSKEQVEEDWKI
jgi:hypothetical protein